MEGSRFQCPGTPPNFELEELSSPSQQGITEEEMDDLRSVLSTTATVKRDHDENGNPLNLHRKSLHATQALNLVRKVSNARLDRRPSRSGILSNLLKLEMYEEGRKKLSFRNKHHGSAPDLSTSQNSTPPRPSHQLKPLTSSKGFLQTVGATPQSARSSLYFDELYKAELGIADDATVVAHRIAIAAEIADILDRQDLIVKLAKSLVRTGAPSHRIEAALEKVGKRLEIDGHYAILPGLIILTFGDVETHTSETHLIRTTRSLDIGKLERANKIASDIARGNLGVDEANELLDSFMKEPPTWNPFVIILGYALTSAFVAPLFFDGSWVDCWVSAIFGLVVGVLTYISEKVPMFGNIFEMLITIPIAIITLALSPKVCFAAVTMASIIIALPGYSLTCSVMELSAKNLISGVVHLVYAIMYVLFLAFGIGYGCSIWRLTHNNEAIDTTASCQSGMNPYWIFLILPLLTLGFAIVFGASIGQWIPMICASAVGYSVHYFVELYVGPGSVITPSAGALALGLFGNIYARVTKRLAFVPILGGIIILVPGSLGVKSAIHLFDGSNESNGGTGLAFVGQVIGIALSLTLGLFLANLLVYPRGKKRSIFLGY